MHGSLLSIFHRSKGSLLNILNIRILAGWESASKSSAVRKSLSTPALTPFSSFSIADQESLIGVEEEDEYGKISIEESKDHL